MYGNVNSNDGYGVSQILLFAPVNRPWTADDVISRGTQPIMCYTDWNSRLVEEWYNHSCRRGKIWEIGGNLAIPHTYIHQLHTYEKKKSNVRAKTLAATDSLRLLFLNCSFSHFFLLSLSPGPNSYLIFNRLTRPMQPHCHFRCRQTASIRPHRPRKQNELFPIYYQGRYLPPRCCWWGEICELFSFRASAHVRRVYFELLYLKHQHSELEWWMSMTYCICQNRLYYHIFLLFQCTNILRKFTYIFCTSTFQPWTR